MPFSVSGKRNECQEELNKTGLLPPKSSVTRGERQRPKAKQSTIIQMGDRWKSSRGEEGKEQRVPCCLAVQKASGAGG